MRPLIMVMMVLMAIIAPIVSAQSIVISQVLYDPADESGGEAVELYNPLDTGVDLSFAELRSESQQADATLPNNTVIAAQSYYLIADVGWETDRQDPGWPGADHEETLTLYNTDSGIALVVGGVIVDAVGWGDASGIEEGLYEGTPSNHTPEGSTLLRDTDTDDNRADFVVDATPRFRASSVREEGTQVLEVTATILGSEASVIDLYLPPDEDEETEGVQYFPVPGAEKILIIEAEGEDPDGREGMPAPVLTFDGQSMDMLPVENLSPTNLLFRKDLVLPFHQQAKEYVIEVSMDGSSIEGRFSLLPMAGIEVDTSSLSFVSSIGASMDVIGDQDMGSPDHPTLQNIGNVPLDIMVQGSDFYSEEDVLDLDAFTYSLSGSSFVGSLSGPLSKEPALVDLNLPPGALSLNELSFRFEPLPNNRPGSYTGSILLAGVAS